MKEKILEIIYKVIDDINEIAIVNKSETIDKSVDEILFDKNGGGKLDSLALVAFLVALEERIEKSLGEVISLDIGAIDISNPFRTIENMRDHIVEIINKKPVSKKIVIVDLDNTLWEGVVGDDGWENLRIHGKYGKLQEELKSLGKKGVLLAIASKNEEKVALEAINKHPGMILELFDFITWRMNWKSKSNNIADILNDINLGPESAVFIDDNPVERDEVSQFLPEVTSMDALDSSLFKTENLTTEDIHRGQMYKHERERKNLLNEGLTQDEWIASLQMRIEVNELNKEDLPRTAQLFNKTNQMNMTTRRMDEDELWKWSQSVNNKMFTIRVADKFGDSGLVGIVSLDRGTGQIVDFILSCRVMGRKVEESMLHMIVQYAKSMGLEQVWVKHIKTERNNPCLEFFQNNSGFDPAGEMYLYYFFFWNTKNEYVFDIIDINERISGGG